jgi:hypothetical protein
MLFKIHQSKNNNKICYSINIKYYIIATFLSFYSEIDFLSLIEVIFYRYR